ncbi:MAG TPA: response regulator transcription factor [Bacteroidetes bacterium]|nr:response regulator transcription factor [Bacteroidota bacterium]
MGKINILIVEDDPIIAADLEDRLSEMGFGIMGPIASGEDALPFFNQKPFPDLALLDIQLEGEWDGIETARRIRQKQGLPIIFLTSNSDDATFAQAQKTKPQAFLSKPYRGRDLKHAIELALSHFIKKESTAEPADNAYLLNDRLFIKVKQRMQRLFFKDILWIEADDYYCKIITREKEILVTKTLKKFSEDISAKPEFLRVHRSYIVNLSHIEAIGELYLHIGKNKIPVSRNLREELLARLKNI